MDKRTALLSASRSSLQDLRTMLSELERRADGLSSEKLELLLRVSGELGTCARMMLDDSKPLALVS